MSDQSRLREHPAKRFAPSEHSLSLDEEFDKLSGEKHPAVNGHRQEAIYKHGPMTLVVFAFDSGGFMKEHEVRDGTVTIHVLEGDLTVRTSENEYRLSRNGVLLLAPGVKHDVMAAQQSRMLLTVNLEGPKSQDA